MLPIKCRMEFAAVQIVECENPHLREPEQLLHRWNRRHRDRWTHCAADDRRGLDLYLSVAVTYGDPAPAVAAASNTQRRVARPSVGNRADDPVKRLVNFVQRGVAVIDRQVGEVYVDGKARQVAMEEVDRGTPSRRTPPARPRTAARR